MGFGPLVIQPSYAEVDSVECLATKLLRRGDAVSIERGQLAIQPASSKPVPAEWMNANAREICRSILVAAGIDAYEYVGHRTGHYGKRRAAGLTLIFASVITGEPAYAIFNVDLARKRTTTGGKAGDPLPAGEFRVGERSHFYKFWASMGLQMPDRMQRFHKCMGKLSSFLLTGSVTNERLDVQSIRHVTIAVDQARSAILGHKEGTTKSQGGHKEGTISGHKETATDHELQGFQPNSTTCAENHGNKVIREYGNKISICSPIHTLKPPQEQSVDEWLEAYSST